MTKKTDKMVYLQEVINVYAWKIKTLDKPNIYYSDCHKSVADSIDGLVDNIRDLGTLNIYAADGKRVYKFTEVKTVYTDGSSKTEKVDLSSFWLIKQAQMAYEKKLESERNKCEDDHLSFDDCMDLIIDQCSQQEVEDYKALYIY